MSDGFSAPRNLGEGADAWPGSEEPTLPEFETAVRSSPSSRRLSRRRVTIAALVVGLLVVAGAIGVLGYLAWTNHDRAGRWQERAATLERNAAALNTLLIERSETLNERTRELNAMAAKVQESQRALRRSESDVATLARRQRELANEKAQVEDARAALAAQASELEDVAAAYVDCKDGLIDLLGYLANEDYASANTAADAVSADCEYADDALAGYLSSHG